MKLQNESAQQRELWEAMDIVIGATPVSPPPTAQASPNRKDIQPILDRIGEREKQWSRAA